MKYCSECSSPVNLKIPENDSLPRYVCSSCERIHYQNPKIVTGCLAVWEEKILLCRRAIEPAYGLWTLPAGFMENNESLETKWFSETEVPWQKLAFPVIYESIQLYFEDKKNNHSNVHFGDIIRDQHNRINVIRY